MEELSRLPESLRKLALDRFRLLQPHLEEGRPLRLLAIKAGIPYRTAQRWVTRFQRLGLAALVRKKRIDAGVRRTVPVKIKAAIEGLALQRPPVPIAALRRQVQRLAQELGEKSPSYKVVYSIVRALPADLLTLAREGTKAYSEAFDLVHRREASGPNAIWQADHSPLDIFLVSPGGEPEKPWLTIVIDDYSRAVAGYLLAFEPPSTLHTSLALRARQSGARMTPAGIFAASRTCCTPTTAATSPPSSGGGQRRSQNPADLFNARKTEGTRPDRTILFDSGRDVPVRAGWVRTPR